VVGLGLFSHACPAQSGEQGRIMTRVGNHALLNSPQNLGICMIPFGRVI
jgi:hypothetical protein